MTIFPLATDQITAQMWSDGVPPPEIDATKVKETQKKANNTKYSKTINTNIYKNTKNRLVYNDTMGRVVEHLAVAVSPYGWLMTQYGWLAG